MKVTAATTIRVPLTEVWRKSQIPEEHVRWDLRFTDIEYLPKLRAEDPQRFRYATRLGFGLAVEGWGESIAARQDTSSALRFGSEDGKSLIREGSGSWTYRETGSGTAFSTVYDYSTRYGAVGWLIDRVVFRPLIQWATRWSFDRLWIWLEDGISPGVSLRTWTAKVTARAMLALVWMHEGLVPKIVAVRMSELDLVTRSGVLLGTPERTLQLLGLLEIAFGLWLLWGRLERVSSLLSCVAVLLLTYIVVATEPSAWYDPFGGISKNLGLLGCASAVWLLSPVAPLAARGRQR